MNFVLDASIALAWCFEDEETPATQALLDRLEKETAFVPNLWPLEIGNSLIAAKRRKRLTYAAVTQCIMLLDGLNIYIDTETTAKAFHEILSLAHSENLTTYDTAYLELAMRRGLPLASQDLQLCEAAKRLGVKVISVK